MAISRRNCIFVLGAGMAGFAGTVAAQVQERSFEQSYRSITPRPTPPGDKIEVLDFFWYGCPYCFQLLPLMTEWEKTKPDDVVIRRVPAVLRQEWVPDAHLYYTLDSLGAAERLHTSVFEAIHRERLQSTDTEAWANWAVNKGLERDKWDEAYNAKDVRDKVIRAVELGREYDIRGTPVLIVDGQYQTGGGQAGSLKNVMPTVDGLIKLARERRKKA